MAGKEEASGSGRILKVPGMCVDSTVGGEDMGVDLETDFEWEPEVCVGLGVNALGQGCWSI